MKKVKVSIISSDEIRLDEDASKGDIINLKEVTNVDLTFISKLINNEKEKEIDKKIKLETDKLIENFNKDKAIYQSTLQSDFLKKKEEYSLNHQKVIDDLNKQIANLQSQLDNYNINKKNEIELVIANLSSKNNEEKEKEKQEFNQRVTSLNEQIQSLNSQIEKNNVEKDLEIEKLNSKYINQINQINNDNSLKQAELQSQIDELSRRKSILNIKLIGENLESWCNDTFNQYKTSGAFSNCSWKKDNENVKNEGDNNSTKADYIFRAYSSTDKAFEVTSACLDMKSENPDSKNKLKNADHYKKLDADRNKKNCEYAILVSELEYKSDNDVPILKVDEYKNMYVVRPQYMITFLTILQNLGLKYAELLNQKQQENEKFKSSEDIKAEFEKIKNTYLEKPIESLKIKIEAILKSSDTILKEGEKIKNSASDIINDTLNTISKKIETFEIQINKTSKKIDKINY